MSADIPTAFDASKVNIETLKFMKWLENLSDRLKHRILALSEYDPDKDDEEDIKKSIVYDDSTTETHDFSEINVKNSVHHSCKIAGGIFINYVGENGRSLYPNGEISAAWYEGEKWPGEKKDLEVRYNYDSNPKKGYISMIFETKDGGFDIITVDENGWAIENA